MSGFLKLAERRISNRAYTVEPVSEADLAAVLEAARLAPTACNLQPFRFIVARSAEYRKQVCSASKQAWLAQAPVIIVACTRPDEAWVRRGDRKNHADIDLAIAVDHMTLAAAERGLGTCWICAFDPVVLRQALALPDWLEPVALLPLGHPTGHPEPKRRKPLAELVSYDGLPPR